MPGTNNFVPLSTVTGVFFTSTSTTTYLNLYVSVFPLASVTLTLPTLFVPSVAFAVAVTFPESWTSPFAVSVFLTKFVPLGSPETSIVLIFPELSFTVKVGLNVAPRKITNLLSSAFVVKRLPSICTVGLTVSFTLSVTGIILYCWTRLAFGPVSDTFGNVTFT